MGGHTVKAPELKYGLSVTGVVHPDRILTNGGGREGDRLILTKPLGTGIISTALKAGMVSPQVAEAAAISMATLNRVPAEIAAQFEIHACTDVTGFGLLGHGVEMIEGSGLGMVLQTNELPVPAELQTLCETGLVPAGLHRNRKYFGTHLVIDDGILGFLADVVCDPQTSGGLLFAVAERDTHAFERALTAEGVKAACIGRLVKDPTERVLLK